jgi:tetratricopeptide (TPR) repeat protein
VDDTREFKGLPTQASSGSNSSKEKVINEAVREYQMMGRPKALALKTGIWFRIKRRFFIGAAVGFLITGLVYVFLRPYSYQLPQDSLLSFLDFFCFFPGWMFRDVVADGGLGDGPIEKAAEIVFVALLYGAVIGCVHAVWPGRKCSPALPGCTLEEELSKSPVETNQNPPPLTEVDEFGGGSRKSSSVARPDLPFGPGDTESEEGANPDRDFNDQNIRRLQVGTVIGIAVFLGIGLMFLSARKLTRRTAQGQAEGLENALSQLNSLVPLAKPIPQAEGLTSSPPDTSPSNYSVGFQAKPQPTATEPAPTVNTSPENDVSDQSFRDAIRADDVMKVQSMLKRNPDLVFSKNTGGFTPLHIAAAYNYKDMVELLLANHADVSAKDNFGNTPSRYAEDDSHKDVAALLQQHESEDTNINQTASGQISNPLSAAPSQQQSVLQPQLQEVVKLAQAKISDDVILAYIKASGISVSLTSDEILSLTGQGVSQSVIDALAHANSAPPNQSPASERSSSLPPPIAPGSVEALVNNGNASYNSGQYDAAARWFDQALAINPQFAHALYGKAVAEDALRHPTRAIQNYRKFIKLAGPEDSGLVAIARERLSKLGWRAEY